MGGSISQPLATSHFYLSQGFRASLVESEKVQTEKVVFRSSENVSSFDFGSGAD
jgi:hypothetical protein